MLLVIFNCLNIVYMYSRILHKKASKIKLFLILIFSISSVPKYLLTPRMLSIRKYQ